MKKENKKESKIKNAFKKFIDIIKKRWLIKGLTTILLIAVILGIYVEANILLDNVVLPEFDMTKNKIYTLSDETQGKVKNLDKEVTITLINFGDNTAIIELIEKYKVLNNKIKIEEIHDLTSRKDLMEKYSLDTSSKGIIIASGENETILAEYDLYTYDYSTYETIDTTEEAITNAIVGVTTEEKPKIYFMSNHTQYNVEKYFYTIMGMMEEDANEVEIVDILLNGKVPEDCDTLVITTLAEDITEMERDKILEYINKGGEILLLNGPNITGKNLTNFQQVLNQYGITVEDGVVFEGDSSKMISGYPDLILEEVQGNSLSANLNMNLNAFFLDGASLKFNEEKQEELKVQYEPLIHTSSKSFLRTNLMLTTVNRTDADSEEREFVVGGIATKTIDENNTSKLIIFGNELFVSDMAIPIGEYQYYLVYQYNNADVVLNSIAYLNEREDIITIRKAYDAVTYTATQLQHNIVMAIIFIIPLVIIILGIIVWQYRRRKR